MTATISLRRADNPSGTFRRVSSAPTFEAAVAAVRGEWPGPALGHGDLVRVAVGGLTDLSVFDADRGHLVPVPGRGPRQISVATWEGPRADAGDMLFAAAGADPRLVAAACLALARAAVSQMATRGSDLPRVMPKALKALAAVDGWIADGGPPTPPERLEMLDNVRVAAALEALAFAERADEAAARRYLSADHRSVWSAGQAASACTATVEFVLYAGSGGGALAARSVARYAAGAATAAPDDGNALEVELRRMAPTVRGIIPLSVAACAAVKARSPRVDIPAGRPDVAPAVRPSAAG